MSNEINLVSKDVSLVERQKSLKIIKLIAITSIVIISTLSILLFIANTMFSPSSIKKEKDATLQGILPLRTRGAKLDSLNNRLVNISEILKGRKDYEVRINQILDLIPKDVSVNAVRTDRNNVLLTVSSSSLLSINRLLNSLIDASLKKQSIKDLTIDSITANGQSGIYTLSIKARLYDI